MGTSPLFIISDLEMGGAQRVVLTVIRHLGERGFKPCLGLVKGKGPLSVDLPLGIPIHRFKAGRVRYAPLAILRLCWGLKPEVVVSTVGHLNLLLLILKPFLPRGTALVIREANTPSIRLLHTRHPRLYGLSYRALYPRCDRLICNCSYMRDDLISRFGFPSEKVSVIPNPVDVERISERVRSEGNPYVGGKVNMVAVGRLNYQKGFDLLLRAIPICARRAPNILLTIVGDGPERAFLMSLAGRLGVSDIVSFAGERQNPFPYMAHADFMVCPSRWEGSPNAVLESLACKTPVLAFDCPGGTAEIIEDGKNGWLIPAEDWKRIGEKMIEIISRKSWSVMKGKSLLPEEHLWQNVVSRWGEVLKNPEGADSGIHSRRNEDKRCNDVFRQSGSGMLG